MNATLIKILGYVSVACSALAVAPGLPSLVQGVAGSVALVLNSLLHISPKV